MFELSYNFKTFIIPFMALLIPLGIFVQRLVRHKVKIILGKKKWTQFFIVWGFLSFLLFAGLIYLTGGINQFFRLEKGLNVTDRDLTWNATEHWAITFIYDPGFSLLVISLLSGLLYASLLVLPKICTFIPVEQEEALAAGSGTAASVSSSFSAAASAVTSTAVCCGTSTIAILAPTIGVVLAPYASGLLIASLALLIYSFNHVVIPRFPVISNKFSNKSLPINI